MAGKVKRFLFIPVLLDLGVLFAIPSAMGSMGARTGTLVIGAAMIFPWVLFFIWSLVISAAIREEVEEHDRQREKDFI
jgi:hypothetical protein